MPVTAVRPLREIIGRNARKIPRAVERAAHPLRRSRVRKTLQRHGMPRAILFVCHGNICRSPYAAAAFMRALPEYARSAMRVESAGFIGPGRPAPREAMTVATRRGVDLAPHVSKLVSSIALDQFDLIVVMDARQRAALHRLYRYDASRIVVLGDVDPQPIERRTVSDPIGQEEGAFESSYARIDRCVSALVEALILA